MPKPSRNPNAVGRKAEAYALDFLQRQGLVLLQRNWRWRGGEIDLILRDRETIVFAEVRCRSSDRFGGAAASVDRRKQARLIQGARYYLACHCSEARTRFDVLALAPKEEAFVVQWIRDAFRADP